jgi:hypothetical protein
VEHHAGDQEPAVAESSHAAEERAEHVGNNKQHGVDQRSEGLMLNADAPDATSSSTIGVMLGTGTGNDNPAAEEDVPEAAVIEEEPKIKEINWAPKEIVQPQRICVARKHMMSGCSTRKTILTELCVSCSAPLTT